MVGSISQVVRFEMHEMDHRREEGGLNVGRW